MTSETIARAGHRTDRVEVPLRPAHTGAASAAWPRYVKAVIDRVGAAVLLVPVLPLLVLLVVVIRLDSPGPALFRQTRTGYGGRPFTMFKLRTMAVGAEEMLPALSHLDRGSGPMVKLSADPRVTRVGRLLRRLSLDELPQLWNVLRGEMSLVGPRPALPCEVAQYDARARRRLDVKPGLTGPWQVGGRATLDWERSIGLDLAYVDGWSLHGDLAVLVRTIGAVVGGRGAR